MKYINFDKIKGTILGVSDIYIDNYYTLSEEGYNEILLNNCPEYYVLVDKINYDNEIVISMNELSNEINYDIKTLRENLVNKSYNYCKTYIEDGIIYNNKHYTYKLEDQMNYEQILNLINNNILISDIPIKASGEREYSYITIEEFKTIYTQLLKNKYFNLFYLQEINNYVKTIENKQMFERYNYETFLPQSYVDIINNKLANFDKLTEV